MSALPYVHTCHPSKSLCGFGSPNYLLILKSRYGRYGTYESPDFPGSHLPYLPYCLTGCSFRPQKRHYGGLRFRSAAVASRIPHPQF